ncbi:MAG: hypothetical protein KDD70_06010 [Bdellovibrionales bacterium]|nr:hypothetical protein [Bdellovibrionales bacterium]
MEMRFSYADGMWRSSLLRVIGTLLFVIVLCHEVFPRQALAEGGITIAVPQISYQVALHSQSNLDKLVVRDPYSEVLRSLSAPPLVSAVQEGDGSAPRIEGLSFVKSLSSDPEKNLTELVIREEIFFSNGSELKARDVAFSLERCSDSHVASGEAANESEDALNRREKIIKQVHVVGDARLQIEGDTVGVFRLLAACPVYERSSGQVFGKELGSSNFYIGLGPFQIDIIRPEIRVGLRKVKDAWTNVSRHSVLQFVDEVEVRAMPDARRALTALRFGSVDLVFTEDSEVRNVAILDETLATGECRGHGVIYRKGLRLECGDVKWVARLRYVG